MWRSNAIHSLWQNTTQNWQIVIAFFGLVFVDQVSKYLAMRAGLVKINPGISFSAFNYLPNQLILVAGGSLIILLGVFLWPQIKSHQVIVTIWLAGAVSNLIDRIWWGGVRDWLSLFGLVSNNLADWLIATSTIWLLIIVLRTKTQKHEA